MHRMNTSRSENYFGGIKAVALFYEQLAGALTSAAREKPLFYGPFLMFSLAFKRKDSYSSPRHPDAGADPHITILRRKNKFDGKPR